LRLLFAAGADFGPTPLSAGEGDNTFDFLQNILFDPPQTAADLMGFERAEGIEMPRYPV
jgi:hypothetical protein